MAFADALNPDLTDAQRASRVHSYGDARVEAVVGKIDENTPALLARLFTCADSRYSRAEWVRMVPQWLRNAIVAESKL